MNAHTNKAKQDKTSKATINLC